jgi:hypothetical protein
MYARFDKHTLLFVVQTYRGGPPDVHFANSTTDVRYFLGYPLGNTWIYETPFGPMCKDYRTYVRVAGRLLLCQRVGGELSL